MTPTVKAKTLAWLYPSGAALGGFCLCLVAFGRGVGASETKAAEVEKRVDALEKDHRGDHDLLIEVRSDLKSLLAAKMAESQLAKDLAALRAFLETKTTKEPTK